MGDSFPLNCYHMMFYLVFTLYNGIFIPLFYSVMRILALFNHKIAAGLNGRRHLFTELRQKTQGLSATRPRVWIHISSMGEFEQAKPVVKTIRHELPQAHIILSFFSPSGYLPALKYSDADLITYLPLDSYRGARKFIKLLQPDIHLIIRHDIWPNMQWHLRRSGIPSLLIDASMTPQGLRSSTWFRFILRPIFATFSEIHVTTAGNGRTFEMIYENTQNIHVSGDTRYDQVCERALESGKIDFLRQGGFFIREHCFVAGSTWPSDEKIILPALLDALKRHEHFSVIIAPHETTEEHLSGIEAAFRAHEVRWIRLSQFNAAVRNFQVLLIDRIGLLANLYALGKMAYVGGGFGPGVHNVLEPAAHACAVLFGPRHHNSLEAVALAQRGGGAAITSEADMNHHLDLFFGRPETVMEMGGNARSMVEENVGASQRIVERIRAQLRTVEQKRHG